MTDLLLVGSDDVFRQALAIVVGDYLPACHVLAQTNSLRETLRLLDRDRSIATVVVDLHRRTEDPVGLVAQLLRHRPGVRVLALTEPATSHLTVQLRDAGAIQVIDKSRPLAAILESLALLCSEEGRNGVATTRAAEADEPVRER